MSKVCAVYAIVNLRNRKVYVGSSVDVRRRWANHRRELRGRTHRNRHLLGAWHRYGEDAFDFVIVEQVEDRRSLVAREQAWIDDLRPCEPHRGYNLSPTAGSVLGLRFTPEQKARVSSSLKGKPKSLEHRAAIWSNREVTDEFRADGCERTSKRWPTEEHVAPPPDRCRPARRSEPSGGVDRC